jgi:hypothetical protein
MNEGNMFTAARPFFAGDIGLMEEDGWVAAASITLCPLPEPERNWSISFEEGTIIGDSAIACSMQLNERGRPYGVASTWYDGVRAGDGSESGDTPGKFAGQHIRHTAAVREACGVDTARINAPCCLQVVEQIADVEYVVRARIPQRTSIPAGVMVWSYNTLWIGNNHIIAISQGREAGAVLLLHR